MRYIVIVEMLPIFVYSMLLILLGLMVHVIVVKKSLFPPTQKIFIDF